MAFTDVPAPSSEPIAIIGMGCRLPGAVDSPSQLWQLLLSGRDVMTEMPPDRMNPDLLARLATRGPAKPATWRGGYLADLAGFDAEFFGMAPDAAKMADPQHRLLMEVVWEALEHAGLPPRNLRARRGGVFLGMSHSDYLLRASGRFEHFNAYTGLAGMHAIGAGRIAHLLDWRGPSIALDAACASSLVAVHLACQSLATGESDLAVAGGVSLTITPEVLYALHLLGALSPSGHSRSFDAAADGMARSEGCGIVVLKRLRDAVSDGDRVIAVIRGSGTNQDGRSQTLPMMPSATAQEALFREVLARTGTDPAAVGMIEAHGTGTPTGDPLEFAALSAVYGGGDHPCALGSVKTNVGHLDAASGVIGLLKAALCVRSGLVPQTLHFRSWNPQISAEGTRFYVPTQTGPWPVPGPRLAAASAFGISGSNAHVIVEQPPERRRRRPTQGPGVFTLSAGSKRVLPIAAARLAAWLRDEGAGVPLGDVAHTLALRRSPGPGRLAVVASTRQELVDGLSSHAAGRTSAGVVTGAVALGTSRESVWIFSGQGSHWAGMGRLLLEHEPVFAEVLDFLEPLIAAESGFSVRDAVSSDEQVTGIERVQPVTFAMQVALAAVWRSYGIEPAGVVGHSMGEVAAAVIAGALSMEDGVRVICRRSMIMARVKGAGTMAVVDLDHHAVERDLLARGVTDVVVAVEAGSAMTVVSGATRTVLSLVDSWTSAGRHAQQVAVDVAGHSSQLDPLLPDVALALAEVTPLTPSIRFYSSVLNDPQATPTFDAGYWVANLREPVRLASAIAAAAGDRHTVFLEVSPHPVLASTTRSILAELIDDAVVVPTLRRGEDPRASLRLHAAMLHCAGVDVDWSRAYGQGELADVPTMTFDRRRHWLDLPEPEARRAASGDHPLLGRCVPVPGSPVRYLWESELGTAEVPWSADHRIGGTATLSGAALCEMALAAGCQAFDAGPTGIEVSGMTFGALLTLGEQTSATASLQLTAPDRARFEVCTRQSDGTWVQHATCEVVHHPIGLAASLREPETAPRVAMDPAHLYGVLEALGVELGPAFAGVTSIAIATSGSRAEIARPPDGGRLHIHPALLDSCLQTFPAAAFGASGPVPAGGSFVFTGLGSLRVFDDVGLAKTCEAGYTTAGAQELVGWLRILDEAGAVLAEVEDMRCVYRQAPAPDGGLYELAWEPCPSPGTAAPPQPGRWLIMGKPEASTLADALRSAGVACNAIDVASSAPEDLHRYRVVVVLPEPSGVPPDPSGHGRVDQVLETLRTMVSRTGEAAPRLWLVTRGAQQVTGTDSISLGDSAVRGLARVADLEHPELRVSVADLDPDRPGLTELAAELMADPAEEEIAFRGGVRYIARLRPINRPGIQGCVQADGSYIVTGGLRGVGLQTALWLAAQGAGRLVLNARRQPDEQTARTLDELRRTGVQVSVVLGDIAEPGTADRLVREAVATGLPLMGVIHSAYVLADAAIADLDDDLLERVWSPKVRGAWRLHEATLGHRLDWFVLFSSMSGTVGQAGQGAYASANAWLGAFASWRRSWGMPALTIDWGPWGEVGSALAYLVPGAPFIDVSYGMSALEALLGHDRAHVVCLPADAATLFASYPVNNASALLAEVLHPRASRKDDLADRLRAAPSGLRRRLLAESYLSDQIRAVLRLEGSSVDPRTCLEALGFDSLRLMELRRLLSGRLEVVIPPRAMAGGRTLADAAADLAQLLGVPIEAARLS